MNLTVYREFPIIKDLGKFILKGIVGVTVNIDYTEPDLEEGINKRVKINNFNNIAFYQMVLIKDDDDKYRKDVLSIEDKNIKKFRPEIEKAIKNKFRKIYKFNECDNLPF